MQYVRNLAKSLPIHCHIDESESQNNHHVVHFKDDKCIDTDVDHA